MRDSLWLQVQMTFKLQMMQQHMFDKNAFDIHNIKFVSSGMKIDNPIISFFVFGEINVHKLQKILSKPLLLVYKLLVQSKKGFYY